MSESDSTIEYPMEENQSVHNSEEERDRSPSPIPPPSPRRRGRQRRRQRRRRGPLRGRGGGPRGRGGPQRGMRGGMAPQRGGPPEVGGPPTAGQFSSGTRSAYMALPLKLCNFTCFLFILGSYKYLFIAKIATFSRQYNNC